MTMHIIQTTRNRNSRGIRYPRMIGFQLSNSDKKYISKEKNRMCEILCLKMSKRGKYKYICIQLMCVLIQLIHTLKNDY